MGSGEQGSKAIRNYTDLVVWQEAMKLVELTYRLARRLPSVEKYGLYSQMTRAALSVPANIAEGHGSGRRRVFLQHLTVSRGSLYELETYLTLVTRLGLVPDATVRPVASQLPSVARLLNALIRSLRSADAD